MIVIDLLLVAIIESYSESPKFLDKEMTSSVVHLGARHLSLTTGRFLTQDPKQEYLSHYNYGKGDIMTVSDPTGYGEDEDIIKAIQSALDQTDKIISDSIQENMTKVTIETKGVRLKINNSVITGAGNAGFLDEHGMRITVERENDIPEKHKPVIAWHKFEDIEHKVKKNKFIPAWESNKSPFNPKYDKVEEGGYSLKKKAILATTFVAAQLLVVSGLIWILTRKK